uniref:Protein Vpu n=1 Tax=Strongyloides papillosus TaxID=174720 RepID=A0A0N5BEQ7_STREA
MAIADDLEVIIRYSRTEIFLLIILVVLYFDIHYFTRTRAVKIIEELDKMDRDLESGKNIIINFLDSQQSVNAAPSEVPSMVDPAVRSSVASGVSTHQSADPSAYKKSL